MLLRQNITSQFIVFLVIYRERNPQPIWWPAGIEFKSGNVMRETEEDWRALPIMVLDSFLAHHRLQANGAVAVNLHPNHNVVLNDGVILCY